MPYTKPGDGTVVLSSGIGGWAASIDCNGFSKPIHFLDLAIRIIFEQMFPFSLILKKSATKMKALFQLSLICLIALALLFQSCEKEASEGPSNPDGPGQSSPDTAYLIVEGVKLDNGVVSDISQTGATITGAFLSLAPMTFPITSHGHVWSENFQLPTLENADGHTKLGIRAVLGQYTSYLTGLQPGTRYDVRAYVASNGQIAYHPRSVSFTTLPASKPVITLSLEEVGQNILQYRR